MKTELNCKNCGERPSCWYGQNKEPKKCDSYWNATSIIKDDSTSLRNVKCHKCGFSKAVLPSVLQWRCPNCKHWIKVELGKNRIYDI